MFRISKQLAISQSIRACQTTEELCQWFRVIINQIDIHDARKITAKTFLEFKSRFNDQLIDHLLVSGPIKYTIANNEINNDSVKTNNNDNKQNKTICKFDLLPNGVFYHISSYLPIKSNLNLSMTSHSCHEKVQNDSCLGINKGGDHDIVKLNPVMVDNVAQNNCIMECIHKHTSIDIDTPGHWAYSDIDCTNCPVSRLINKINSNSNKNYDLLWFKKIWQNVTNIYISNSYACVLKHIPISWLFQDKHQVLKPIQVLAAAKESNGSRGCCINKTIMKSFAKRVKNYINCNDNPENPGKKIRQIQRIWYDSNECDSIEIDSSFGNSLTGILVHLPRLWDNKCRFQDLETFFNIFHKNINWLEVFIDKNNIGDRDIISQLFKNNLQLCHDLNKTEEQLPFNQFLKRYDCQNKCLPKIGHLAIDFENIFSYEQSALFKLLNNDKIMKLFNVQESVCSLSFLLFPGVTEVIKHDWKTNIENLIGLVLSKLDSLTACRYTVRPQNTIIQQDMEKCFDLSNAILLHMLLKPKARHVSAMISPRKWTHKTVVKFRLKIENKNELLYCNRDALKRKISSLVNDSIQAAKQIWCKSNETKIEQRFQFERDYSM